MKVKTSELTGAALDWAVAKCEGCRWAEVTNNPLRFKHTLKRIPHYSSDWAQGGPIIDREKFGVCHYNESDGWEVPNWAAWRTDVDDRVQIMGETALIAAMRCYVASKLGDEVDVPDGGL